MIVRSGNLFGFTVPHSDLSRALRKMRNHVGKMSARQKQPSVLFSASIRGCSTEVK
jgi:hypothetical protein